VDVHEDRCRYLGYTQKKAHVSTMIAKYVYTHACMCVCGAGDINGVCVWCVCVCGGGGHGRTHDTPLFAACGDGPVEPLDLWRVDLLWHATATCNTQHQL
jgi:hypothetical protein